MHPAGSPINPIFLVSSASHESVLQVSVNQDVYTGSMEELKENIRKKIAENHPKVRFNFEPMELTEKIMGQGAMTPIEVKVGANQVKVAFAHASKIEARLKEVPYLRDVRIAEALSYPTLDIDVDRDLAGQFGSSEERRVGQECVSTCRSRWSPYPYSIDIFTAWFRS